MAGKPNLFAHLAATPPDDLAALCRKLQEEKPETARIMASALGGVAPERPFLVAPKPAPVPQRPPLLKSVPKEDSEALVSGAIPHGYEAIPEAMGDRDP